MLFLLVHKRKVKKIRIETLEEYLEQIEPPFGKTEANYIYRGQQNKTWQVQSKATRRMLQLKEEGHPDSLHALLIGYLQDVIDIIKLRLPHIYINMEQMECMVHLYYKKVSTGLINFTYSSVAALWFACEDDDSEDGKVFMLDTYSHNIEEIKSRKEVRKSLQFFFQDDEKWYLWQPPDRKFEVDNTMITSKQSQQFVFMFGMPEVPENMFEKTFIIPKGRKEALRKELERRR